MREVEGTYEKQHGQDIGSCDRSPATNAGAQTACDGGQAVVTELNFQYDGRVSWPERYGTANPDIVDIAA